MNEQLFHVSASPHVRDKATTNRIMLDVIIALMPATIFGVLHFGLYALLNVVVCVLTCVIAEAAIQKILKRKVTVMDCSAALTGLLLALNLPPNAPFWIAILGGLFSIIIAKQLFGGLGQNFMNPALAGRCFLLISFAKYMTDFSYNAFVIGSESFDSVTGATPLALVKDGALTSVRLKDLFFGTTAGTIGETSVVALAIGGLYLLIRKVISLRIPATYIITAVLFALIFGGHGFDIRYLLEYTFSGGLILGAIFMATDYATSPMTAKGQIVYGIVLGIFTGLFRIFGASAEGVSYAIIFSNLLVPLIERVTVPTSFGKSKGGKK